MTEAITDARKLIQSRLADLDAEVKKLERVLVGLGEGRSSPRRRPRRARKNASTGVAPSHRKGVSRKGDKRARRGQRRKELLAAIKDSPGARPADLAKAIGVKPSQVHALIRKACADKLIAKHGKGYALAAAAQP